MYNLTDFMIKFILPISNLFRYVRYMFTNVYLDIHSTQTTADHFSQLTQRKSQSVILSHKSFQDVRFRSKNHNHFLDSGLSLTFVLIKELP